jgi:aminopeptidase N
MRRALLVGGLIACGGSDDPGPQGDATAQITHYEYKFDIATRVAHAKLTAVLDAPGNCVTLNLRATAGAGGFVADGEAPIEGTAFANDQLKICSAHGHDAGEAMTIEADMTVPVATLSNSQVGYSIKNDSQQNPFHYLVSWVGGCDQFGPCDARPSTFATYTFDVTHPATLDVRCSGTITEVSDTNTRCEFAHEGGPTYSTFGIAAYGAWTQIPKGQWGSVQVTLYDRVQTKIDSLTDPAYHDGFIKFMESTFGPYPYGNELRVLTAPTYWSGFEHPGNIVLDDALAFGSSGYLHPVAHVLDHEIAHQWAGDQTTLLDTYDFVWKEAMAEYLAYVYEEMAEPAAGAQTARAWKMFSVGTKFYPVPMEKPPLFDYYGDVYGPGPMILFRQLEVLSSRAQVLDALKSVLGSPRALSVDELVAALAEKTGLDLSSYTAAWIKGTGVPVFPSATATFTEPSTLHVVITTAPEKRCKFSVALTDGAANRMIVPVDTFRNGVDQTLTVNPGFTVTTTEIDPNSECLIRSTAFAPEIRVPNPWRGEKPR